MVTSEVWFALCNTALGWCSCISYWLLGRPTGAISLSYIAGVNQAMLPICNMVLLNHLCGVKSLSYCFSRRAALVVELVKRADKAMTKPC